MLQFPKKVAAMSPSKLLSRWQGSVGTGLLLVLLVVVATAGAQTVPKSKKSKPKAAEAPAPEAAAPTPPPAPPTPEQMPPRPPTVSYQNGQLSIVAPNSTLSDILQAVKSKTGAAIDIPPNANERVVSRFGPGPARDVLAALLNGSHFNYVMIGSDASPTSVAQVILTPRVGGETPPTNPSYGQMQNAGAPQYSGQVVQPQHYPGGQPAYQQPPGAAATDEPPPDSEQDDSAQQDNTAGTDEGAPEQVNQGADGQENNGQPQVKTPEQLLQELQRQQQIQQQQQQQGQPVPPPAPPQ